MNIIEMKNIESDERRIKMLVLSDGTQIQNKPGMDITPYCENGQMAHITWFRVSGVKCQRVNGAYVQQVIY